MGHVATARPETPAPPAPAPGRLHPLDAGLGLALALLLVGSLVGLPAAVARIPDGRDRLQLMGWTLALAALLAVPAARPVYRMHVVERGAGAEYVALEPLLSPGPLRLR